jgi:hypothetical protein
MPTISIGHISEPNQYFGITRPVLLNTAVDRSKGSFDYWGIADEGGTYKWILFRKIFMIRYSNE